uniref:Protein FAN n=1 Tax=Cacopsylla melanoneura TaxID=428564 RepID=A0A8D8WJ65_9HEMI
MERERFSLLLMEPGEFYFDDLSVNLILNLDKVSEESRPGRLKICSKSLVFDPKNLALPLIKIPLKDCTSLSKFESPLISKISGNTLDITCTAYIEMLAGNILAPYVFETKTQRFLFVLNYGQIDVCLGSIEQLHRAASLPAAEQNQMVATIATGRQSKVSFNKSWLDDLDEEIILETFGNKITPLVVNPGRIVLSSTNLYFQPFNNIEPHKLLKVQLAGIKRIIRRRFLLQQVGIEIYFKELEPVKHLYLTLKTPGARDTLYNALLDLPELQLSHSDKEIMTLRWQNGVLSNYDYLMYLNSLADRSLNDLTQYPVFPWVISNYTCDTLDLSDPKNYRDLSKPIGALNATRLERLKERYNEMPPPKFLYGSHYSTPGFVLFYLVRKFPQYMLCLQNGRFDHPDRMFNSIPDIWRNVLTNMSDFKEMVPEFYDLEQKGDFLENSFGINFGYRYDGTKVDSVQLPPWAKSPEVFVNKLRQALESDIVSRQLHLWIDLIFGYKQRGLAADNADNLFYYLCYEGSVDLDKVKDWNQRHALEVQIMEFGQIPKQIFIAPHPARTCSQSSLLKQHTLLNNTQQDTWGDKVLLEPVHFCQSHKDAITSVAICHESVSVASVGRDTLLKIHSLKLGRQERSAVLGSMTLSSLRILPDNSTIIVGCWDSCVIVYDVECGRILTGLAGHEDAISCVEWDEKRKRLISGSWDCTVRVWKPKESWANMKPTNSLVSQLDLDNRIKCMAITKDNDQLAVGTEAGELIIWSLEDHLITQQLSGEVGASVNGVAFSEDGRRVISCGNNCILSVYDLTTGMQVCNQVFDEKLLCLAWAGGSRIVLGGAQGTVYLFDLVHVLLLKQVRVHRDAVLCVNVSEKGDVMVSGGEDHQLIIWEIS